MKNKKIAIIGLGYVGLPLAIAFSEYFKVVGFDIDKKRINQLLANKDITNELDKNKLKKLKKINLTYKPKDLKTCDIYIITVPTPIDRQKKPDLTFLLSASQVVGKSISKGNIIIYESTVYPGATEGDCVPVLEKYSRLKYNKDFYCGYSPERINPGDKKNNLKNIKKITSGSTAEIAYFINNLYLKIIDAGTHMTSSIKVAEAAKVIENIQRDVNIALINELSMIFSALEIDSEEVLDAASTKWNFIPYKPGLVGGHCISVDPYYLTHKAKSQGISSQVILSSRKVNDSMANHIVNQLIKTMVNRELQIKNSNVLIMGFTFKENCNDLRNTMVSELVLGLREYECNIDVFDPLIDIKETKKIYGFNFISKIKSQKYDSIILAVAHDEFKLTGINKIRKYGKSNAIIYDLKHMFLKDESDLRL